MSYLFAPPNDQNNPEMARFLKHQKWYEKYKSLIRPSVTVWPHWRTLFLKDEGVVISINQILSQIINHRTAESGICHER